MADPATNEINTLSMRARQATLAEDWATVDACARQILARDASNTEGLYLSGLVYKASQRPVIAAECFEKAITGNPERYDAAIELATQYSVMRRNGDAAALIERYEDRLGNSPVYLNMAGTTYTEVGLNERAWPLFKKAIELQPGVDLFQANLAAAGVYLGKIEEAKQIYHALLERFPNHRRNHYLLSRLGKATDDTHVQQMKQVLANTNEPPDQNIYIHYAIAKELEDLERWDESFEHYKKAGDAVVSVANYDVNTDVKLIDRIIDTCTAEWLTNSPAVTSYEKTPIFIVGLPRTGTTLTDRIISSHSTVSSLGETQFLQMVLRMESRVPTIEQMNTDIVDAVATKDMSRIGRGYLDNVAYRLGNESFFIEKLPFNYLFLGFIAKAFPDARIVFLHRNPVDACFSMYKQVFTWAYKFSYSLDWLGEYYVAYNRLVRHWQSLLGTRTRHRVRQQAQSRSGKRYIPLLYSAGRDTSRTWHL
jgi:tetratricopeptide (TPR) repeat protein